MRLNGQQMMHLSKVLDETFDRSSLHLFMADRLDRRLDFYADAPMPLRETVFTITAAADREGWIDELVSAALEEYPNNLELQQIAQELGTESRPPQPVRTLRVFLCHSSSDKPRIRGLYRKLSGDEIQPWFDEEDILPGQDWAFEIGEAIRSCDLVLVCLSEGSVTKVGYLQKEIRQVLDVADEQPDGTVFIIPARLEPCDVPDRLRRWQWVDLFKNTGYEKLLQTLRRKASLLE